MEAALFGAALGGTRQFSTFWIQNIGWHRFKETGGIVLVGLGRREMAFHATIVQSLGDGSMDGLIGGKSARRRQRMEWGQDKGVGEILAMLHQAPTRVSPNKRPIGRRDRCFLKVTQGHGGV